MKFNNFMTAGRFAPSTTGHGHVGTILNALLSYADCRSLAGRFIVRMEDLDQQRCRQEYDASFGDMLLWLDIEWDHCERQTTLLDRYAEAMDVLAQQGRLYACSCSRADLKDAALAADGGRIYPGTCRKSLLDKKSWRDCEHAIRFCLDDAWIDISDQSIGAVNGTVNGNLSQNPLTAMGDPIVRRKDRAYAYQLVVVVDDAAQGINRVVRGHDLAASTATQCALQTALGYQRPAYYHHYLLLEQQQQKLAKLHQSVSWLQVREAYSADQLRGVLAHASGLSVDDEALTMAQFIELFSWAKINGDDLLMTFSKDTLHWTRN
ncbi:MAG: hypothetical protein HRU15_04985 [Planctomycetes bacterium]|nr:hypothetical protein [Planctomycetota bacterium]